jgi:hypothetical protein
MLPSRNSSRQATMMLYDERQEILKGKVKRLIETGLSRGGGEFYMQYADSVFFDKDGNQLAEKANFGDWQYQVDYNFSYEGGHKSLQLPWPRAIGKRDYEFDNYGHLTDLCYYNEDGFFEKSKYIYNSSGQLIEVKTYDKKGVLRSGYQLNYQGGFLSGEGQYASYQYPVFDKHGNWTKKIRIERDDKDNTIAEQDTVIRKITYY